MTEPARLDPFHQDISQRRLSRREFIHRAVLLGLSGSALGPLLAACRPSPVSAPPAPAGQASAPGVVATTTPAPVVGGELRLATTTEAVTLHPFKFTDTPSGTYIDLMYYMPMLQPDGDTLEMKPFVAKTFRESDDHTLITFTLRDNLQWSDGHPLSADDYAWTWSRISDKANGWPWLGNYAPYVESVRAVDGQTLEVRLKVALAISLAKANDALGRVLPRHIWQDLDWTDPNANPAILKPTVVAGPYRLTEWHKDEYATFAANERFFLGRPPIDRLTYRVFGNTSTAAQALLNGEIDVYGPEPEDWQAAKNSDRLTCYQWDAPWLAVTYIGLNLRQPALRDKAVRQALNYALDKEAIVEKLTGGLGRRAMGMYLPTSWAAAPNLNPYRQDVERARQLLESAGWKVGASGVREKDGQPLKLLFLFGPNAAPVREQIALIVQQQWKAIGVDVDIRGLEWGAYLKVTGEGPYDWAAFVNAYIPSIDPDTLWWKKEASPTYNRADYHNPRVEELYEQGLKELDQARRKAIYQEIQTILNDDSPWIWLYYQQSYTAASKRVRGIRLSRALGINDMWEWWLQPA